MKRIPKQYSCKFYRWGGKCALTGILYCTGTKGCPIYIKGPREPLRKGVKNA